MLRRTAANPIALVVLAVGLTSGCGLWRGCGDETWQDSAKSESILNQHPPGTTEAARGGNCDSDSGVSTYAVTLEAGALTDAKAQQFYDVAAPAAGWTRTGDEWTKVVGGNTLHLGTTVLAGKLYLTLADSH